MHTLKILWPKTIPPNDCRWHFAYGWTYPLYCVAGSLKADTVDEANNILRSLRTIDEWEVIRRQCGAIPVVFARVQFGELEQVVLEVFGYSGTIPIVVYYQPPNLRNMEIYTFDFRIYETVIQPSFIRGHTHDFTTPVIPEHSLNPQVLEQLNHGSLLTRQVQDRNARCIPNELFLSSGLLRVRDSALVQLTAHCFGRVTRLKSTLSLLRLLHTARAIASDIGACSHQVDVRLEQCFMLPLQVPRLYRSTVPSTSRYISFYVHFWNTVWLILNDITIGVALGTFLCENALPIAQLVHGPLKTSLVHIPQEALLWLNNWPAGLKLNTELSHFYCHSLLGIVVAWSRVLETVLLPALPKLLYITGALGTCGLTMTVSMLSDLLSCFTFHLFVCYRASALIYSYQLTVAGSLWNLFQGKRYNILRNRKDAWDYDVDQLLLGTMLFTLVAFLSPTIFTYYAFFATARLFVVVMHAGLDTILVLMNHFPLFALLLRAKSPFRMPDGVVYQLSRDDSPPTIEIQPIAFARIFDQYVGLGSQLWSHYHPLRLLRMLLQGGPLTTIPRSLIRLSSTHDTRESHSTVA